MNRARRERVGRLRKLALSTASATRQILAAQAKLGAVTNVARIIDFIAQVSIELIAS